MTLWIYILIYLKNMLNKFVAKSCNLHKNFNLTICWYEQNKLMSKGQGWSNAGKFNFSLCSLLKTPSGWWIWVEAMFVRCGHSLQFFMMSKKKYWCICRGIIFRFFKHVIKVIVRIQFHTITWNFFIFFKLFMNSKYVLYVILFIKSCKINLFV